MTVSTDRFRSKHAAEICGVSFRRVDYLDRCGVVRPSIVQSVGSGSRRVYDRVDLYVIAATAALYDRGMASARPGNGPPVDSAEIARQISEIYRTLDDVRHLPAPIVIVDPAGRVLIPDDLSDALSGDWRAVWLLDLNRVRADVDLAIEAHGEA